MCTRCYHNLWLCLLLLLTNGTIALSQTLPLPPRPTNAPSGNEFINIISPMSLTERENWILSQIQIGNVPSWLTNLVPITITRTISGVPHTVTYYVTPDYMAIGSDQDYFLEPMTPLLAQRVADLLNCTLPTRRMVDINWTNAAVKLAPSTIPPSGAMTTVPVFADHNATVRGQRNATTNAHPLGALVSGDKKDVIISTNIYGNPSPGRVVIYGWHYQTGVNIQPVYDGHEETYADYSHGIRLVQMAVTLDGLSSTVTNILTHPTLWPLLSDEGVITVPRYPRYATAPVITGQPRSQTVDPGANVSLSALAVGYLPLGFQWRINGVPIVGATKSTLSLTNVQTGQAGTYTVVITNGVGSITSIPAVLTINSLTYPLLFSESFDLASTSTNWNLFWGAGNNIPDYTVDWSYDYEATSYTFNGKTYIIPPAPSSTNGVARAVRLTVNNNDAVGSIAGLSLYPKNKSFSNNFALKFDLWINYPGNTGGTGTGVAGSTEHATFGINHFGAQVNYASTNAASSDGLWFAVDGEGGSGGTDYRAYLGNTTGNPTSLTIGQAGMASGDNTGGVYPALFPGTRFETVGTPGKNWVAVEVAQSNNIVTWKLDGTVVAQRTNSSPFNSGNIMLGFMDVFPSIAAPATNAFVLFDNVRVEDWNNGPLQSPLILVQPQSGNVTVGTNVVFSVLATGTGPLSYQWRLNSVALAGATNSSISLTNVQISNAGAYDVAIANSLGITNSSIATLSLHAPDIPFSSGNILSNGSVALSFYGLANIQYAIESSTNLVNWTSLAVFTGTNGPLSFIDTNAPNHPVRYYRSIVVSE